MLPVIYHCLKGKNPKGIVSKVRISVNAFLKSRRISQRSPLFWLAFMKTMNVNSFFPFWKSIIMFTRYDCSIEFSMQPIHILTCNSIMYLVIRWFNLQLIIKDAEHQIIIRRQGILWSSWNQKRMTTQGEMGKWHPNIANLCK